MEEIEIVYLDMELEKVIYNNTAPYSEAGLDLFKAFISANKWSYYAEPKESFSIQEAKKLATQEGNLAVLVENLS